MHLVISMKVDLEKIKGHKEDFTFFRGFVPPILIRSSGADLIMRDHFLKEIGLYDYVRDQLQEYKDHMYPVDEAADFEDGEVLKFIETNPQFEDILIET